MYKLRQILLGALVMCATNAYSDDSPTDNPVKSPKHKLQACMAKQRQENPSMSNDDIKKQCAQLMQSQENHPSVPASGTPPSP